MRPGLLPDGGVIATQNKPVSIHIVLKSRRVDRSARSLPDRCVIAGKNKTVPVYVSKEGSERNGVGKCVRVIAHVIKRERNKRCAGHVMQIQRVNLIEAGWQRIGCDRVIASRAIDRHWIRKRDNDLMIMAGVRS